MRLPSFWLVVYRIARLMAFIAFVALFIMMSIVCVDVIFRACGNPLKGVYDCVRVLGVLVVSCALPMTTATKGHVAIEYFFQRLNPMGRVIVDTLMRVIMIVGFSLATVECIRRGFRFLHNGEVTQTIQLPIFWVPWVMAVACAVTVFVVVFHLTHPGRNMGH